MLYVNPLAEPIMARAESTAASTPRRKVALQELEHYFLFMLLREMRKTVPPNALFGENQATQMYEEMLDDATSGELARGGGLGIADLIAKQLQAAEIQSSLAKGLSSQDTPIKSHTAPADR